ncbi:MAG TPA: formate dehydrogenase accessory sulfurtransferase FdhD [Rubrivivax sp.]|nr:formate dehydrogenase accessory sulfurtransferase FdhD [Rubrivivax sp.]
MSTQPYPWRLSQPAVPDDGPGPASGAVPRPALSAAGVDPLHEIEIVDEYGERRRIFIPLERPLTVYVDRRELVTLMTLGARPELLVLGYLLNQGLVDSMQAVASIQVDWDVGAAAVVTRAGVTDIEARTSHRVVTTGCGQGTVYGELLSRLDGLKLPPPEEARIRQSTLRALLEVIRAQDSIHRRAGSVHGCALFRGAELLAFVEDVGRHNAVDTIAGWMALHGVAGGDKVFYTTGRLTSEMVMKAAHMGIPIVASRNGVTKMGHALATRLGMTLFGRAANRHFLCYTGFERFDAEPLVPRSPIRVVAADES